MEKNTIIKPDHYQIDHPRIKGEVRFVIEWAVALMPFGDEAYHLASTLKYLLRATRKGKYKDDILKAREHLGYLVEILERGKNVSGEKDERNTTGTSSNQLY